MCACVCTCVCVCEGGREGGRENLKIYSSNFPVDNMLVTMLSIGFSELPLLTENLYPFSYIVPFSPPHSLFSFSLYPFAFYPSVSFKPSFWKSTLTPWPSLGTQHPEFPLSTSSYWGWKNCHSLFQHHSGSQSETWESIQVRISALPFTSLATWNRLLGLSEFSHRKNWAITKK